jgi:hypothetical protein
MNAPMRSLVFIEGLLAQGRCFWKSIIIKRRTFDMKNIRLCLKKSSLCNCYMINKKDITGCYGKQNFWKWRRDLINCRLSFWRECEFYLIIKYSVIENTWKNPNFIVEMWRKKVVPSLPDKVWFLEFRQNLFIIAVSMIETLND